jgi:hypothetical protein
MIALTEVTLLCVLALAIGICFFCLYVVLIALFHIFRD